MRNKLPLMGTLIDQFLLDWKGNDLKSILFGLQDITPVAVNAFKTFSFIHTVSTA